MNSGSKEDNLVKMKVFIAGAGGAIGRRLVPLLVSSNHQVTGTTRTSNKVDLLRACGAEPLVLDGLNKDAVMNAVLSSRPDVIVHQMTALASMRSLKNFDDEFALTNRLRTEGTEHLIAAGQMAGTHKIVVQSYTGWPNAREGSRTKTEEDPFDPNPSKAMTRSLGAIRRLESLVLDASGMTGTVMRYGSLYGPGTSISQNGEIVHMVRQRKFPVIGDGAGVWSFIHVDDAANATRLAIENDRPGIFNIVDDEPAEVAVWLPALAASLGAKRPRHVPAWLGRVLLGEPGLLMMTKIRGSSNEKAKSVLGWKPAFASWRQGFRSLDAINENSAPVMVR
jgi:2-alkyl-3-oxoalkanoate reductase